MSEEVNDTITYIGRTQYDINTHYYILGSDRRKVAFGKKLQRHHAVGRTYPVIITTTEKGTLYSTRKSDLSIDETWVTTHEVAAWAQENAKADRTARAIREAKNLLTNTRKAARQIKDQYTRASYSDRLEMIRAFIEELES